MKICVSKSVRVPIQRAALAMVAAAACLRADTTFTFQNGANGYRAAQDVAINTQYSESNGGNGVLWRGDPELGCYTTTGSGSYTVRYLLKFGSLSIPAGSRVVSATLAIALDSWNSGSGNITGFYLSNAWNGASNRIGWLHRDDANDWSAGGASAAGVDTVSGKSFRVPALRPVGAQTVTIPLDVAQAQAWIDSPSANQGIMLVNNNPGEIIRPVSTAGAQNLRPKLTIVVAAATGVQVTVAPPTATLQPGAVQPFTATVTGSSNTAVTWTATGGTITTAGVYTAGNVAGAFAVTATSVADATKSASSTVTIQPAPVVSVSVSPTSATVQTGQTRQFTATVTGSSNTALTWTATGGTISNTGLFTAGATAGSSFSVTATSVADPTKSASAQVTVPQPASVQVTVSPASVTLQSGGAQQFTATVTGSSNTAVTWTATGGTITSSGLYTAGQNSGSFLVTATSVADTTKSGTAAAQINTTSSLPPIPRQADGPYIRVQSPVSGMRFTAPATIRIYADPSDVNASDQDAFTVKFLLNGQSVGTFTGDAGHNGYWAFTVNNLAAGAYAITTQFTASNNQTVTSPPVTVFVDNPAASTGPVFNLGADVVLTGTQNAMYAGTPGNRCAINGNGFRIRSSGSFTGSLNIVNCDVRGLGAATTPGIDVSVSGSGSVNLSGNVFDTSGTVAIGSSGQAQVTVRGNEFRENTLVPVTSLPTDYSGQTLPVFHATGASSAQKFFQGNNVGLSTVLFEGTNNWLIGGDTDADSNILMGVRCGFTINGSSNMVLRGNYSQHNYPHRMSQGSNFDLQGDGFLAEHNVIRNSSWPVRGMGGELRYNLIDTGGNADQIVQGVGSGTKIHHNLFTFTVSQTLYGPGTGISLIYNVDNVQFYNNVMDGGGTFMKFTGVPISVSSGSLMGSLRNNVFYNFASQIGSPALGGSQGESTTPPLPRLRYSDYNDFFNPDADNQTNYGLSVVGLTAGAAGYGMHDLGGFNGHVNPKFTQPTVLPFPFAPEDIWTRAKKVSDVLATYRSMYTPASGSPLIGAGDPQDGQGGNIGAIGNGEAADRFGKFGSGASTPVAVSIAPTNVPLQTGATMQFTATVTGSSNPSVTWTATGGTVSSTGLYTAGNVAGAFAVTATSVADSTKSASATITIGTVQGGVSVSISPGSATVQASATKQFTATVTGLSNTAVTWTATGGTVSSTGLYTAGPTAGSFSVTATSVADSTKSATATITIPASQPISVTVSPASPTVFTGGSQQFTATVANASNTAVTWTATGGTISSTGLYTAGSTAGSFTVTAASVQDPSKTGSAPVTVSNPPTSGSHPRILLDTATLATLRTRMQSNTAEWKALKATCDSYVGGSVEFINGNDYPNPPNVGEGYQGSGYFDALMPLGLCYQTALQSDPANAAKYGAKGVAILVAMSDPAHQIADEYPCSAGDSLCGVWFRDYGYGIRNFGVAMGIGYDWFWNLLSAAQKTQIQTALNHWIYGFETGRTDSNGVPQGNFEYDHPQGNYFAGYYAAKCMAALAVEGDSPLGTTWWDDWYNKQHLGRVAPYYRANLTGGGWNEGYTQYGILATRNQSLPALAVKTAKGIDLIQAGNAQMSYTYPIDNPRWLMAFTWPSRDMVDDRNELYSTGDSRIWPGTGRLESYRFSAGFLAMLGDPAAPMMHKYARDAKAALDALNAGDSTEWIDFLFWDPAAPEADYSSMQLSYLAPGMGGVTARSDWSPSATFMSFISGPYVNNPGAGHESFEKGSPAFERNKNPLLVNAGAWLAHDPNGDPGWTLKYDDQYGNWSADHDIGNRTLYNTFQVRQLDSQKNLVAPFGQGAFSRDDGARTKIGRYEDGGSYVLSVGQFLEDMYYPFRQPATGQPTICSGAPSAVTSLSRQIVYLRPSQFIIYDRSGVCDSSLDQYLAFHFPANPVEAAAPAPGARRFDVNPGIFAGSMTTVLPASAAVAISDHLINSSDSRTYGKVWRTEVRPTDAPAANRRWITVFDLAPTPGQVAAASALNVTAGAAVGVLLQSSTGSSVVVSGTAPVGTAIPAPLAYTVPAAQTRHVVTDVTPQAGYTVSVTVAGGNHMVTVTSGGSLVATANGVLSFAVTPTGTVQP